MPQFDVVAHGKIAVGDLFSLDRRNITIHSLDLSDTESPKRSKLEVEQTESLIQIRGGGEGDAVGDGGNEKQGSGKVDQNGAGATNDVKQQTATAQPIVPYPMDANYKLYSAMTQSNNQNAMAAAAASSHLLQHQLGLGLQNDPYAAAMAGVPVGSGVGSLSASELSEFYMRNGFGFAGASASTGLGLVSGTDAAAARYSRPHSKCQSDFEFLTALPQRQRVV